MSHVDDEDGPDGEDPLFGVETFNPVAFARASTAFVAFSLLTIMRDQAVDQDQFESQVEVLASNVSGLALSLKDGELDDRMEGAYLMSCMSTFASLAPTFTNPRAWKKD